MPKVCPVCGNTFPDSSVFCPTDGSSLHLADIDGDLIGSVIADRYLITDMLGEGGMGKVYLARHVRLPQQAAIKVLRPEMKRDTDVVARFNREAANASRIEHERIARVFDYGESADGTVYLAMEYVPGRTLRTLLAADGAQSPERTAVLTRQVAEALDAAHRLGIVHRDLKPDNIMVIEDPDLGDRCKVVDFGIAKAMGGDAGEKALTRTGFVIGTPEFMSPEQLLGGAIDHRSDVYALALVSYQCLVGVLPFDVNTPGGGITQRLVEGAKPLAVVRPDIAWPASLQQVFDRGLAREPDDRYASAGEFARALESEVAAWRSAAAHGATAVPDAGPAVDAHSSQPAASPASAQTGHAARSVPASRTPWRGVGVAVGVSAVLAVGGFLFTRTGPGDGETVSSNGGAAELASGAATFSPPTTPPAPTELDSVAVAPGNERERDDTAANTGGADSDTNREVPGSSGNVAAPEPVATPPTSSSSRVTPPAVRRTLDSIRLALDPLTASPADARRGIAVLRDLMPRLATQEDSAWGYLRQAEAHFIMDDERSACVALQTARPIVKTASQRQVITLMSSALSTDC